jgi:hypothetical protein
MNKNNYIYEFIPYERIGTIKINKVNSIEPTSLQSTNWLQETSINYVICKVLYLDNPEEIRRNGENHNYVYLKYNNQTIELTCYFNKFINNLKEICNDIEIVNDDEFTYIYSDTLGITAIAETFKEFENQKLIRLIAFSGKEEYEKMKNDKLVNKEYNSYKINDNISFENEETKREYQKYLDEMNDYNEKIARGENPNIDITELTKKFKEKFKLLDNNNDEIVSELKTPSIDFNNDDLINKIDESINKVEENINLTINNMIKSYLDIYDENENQIATNLCNNGVRTDLHFIVGNRMGNKYKVYVYIDNGKARFIDNGVIKNVDLDEFKINGIKNTIVENIINKDFYNQLKCIYNEMSEMETGVKNIFEIYVDGIYISIPYALSTIWGKELLLKIYELL